MAQHLETVRELRYGFSIVAEHDYTGCIELFTRAYNGALTPLGVVRKVDGYRPGIVHYHTSGERFDSLAEAADYLLDEANERDMAEWEAAHDRAADAYAEHQAICASTHRPRGYRCMIPYRAGFVAALLALALTGQHASAHTPNDTRPVIGSPAYDAGCIITATYEDGSATALCPEDGARYVFDPDGDSTTGKRPGWYLVNE